MSSSSNSQIPTIRSFQMDSSSAGVLKNSVNLFRGDVNYSQALFSMPGRMDNDGLEVDLSIQYQSNVNQQAFTWNRDQPTGVLGMGWNVSAPSITLDNGGSPTAGSAQYSISNSGCSGQLVREPQTPFLFSMSADLAGELKDGQIIPAAIVGQFAQFGLPLSANAVVQGSASPWLVNDDALEQQFKLLAENGVLNAYDGGESYQPASYSFWKLIYYPQYERWAVTDNNGRVLSYGGGVGSTAQAYHTSAGNSIEWAVGWADGNGLLNWLGNSANPQGQRQYASAWHLHKIVSRFGESVSFAYNEFARDGSGLLPVEQLVGVGGKPYTKACHLTSITDVFGRKAVFNYLDKLWSNATDGSPREYADPHKSVPDNTPNGFQDCYQTRYLDGIDVFYTDDTRLFSVQFVYEPSPGNGAASAVANVAGSSGDICKRLLTGMQLINAAGESLPGFNYDYHLDTTASTNLGALNTITYPSGGTVSYAYTPTSLDICQRTATLTPPAPLGQGSIPRVWFGPNYSVVTWYNPATAQLSMQILSWNGQWVAWQAEPGNVLLVDGKSVSGIDLTTLDVQATENFVAISYNTENNANLQLFRLDPARPGQWVAASIAGLGAGGCNAPLKAWPLANGILTVTAGQNFVLAAQMNTNIGNYGSGSADVFTWDWPSQGWSHASQTNPTYTWFIAQSEYIVSVNMQGLVTLSYLDPVGKWHEKCSTVTLNLSLNDFESLSVVGDVSMVAVANLLAGNPGYGSYSYDIYLIQWNQDYQFSAPSKHSFTDYFDSNYPTSWIPSIISNSLVAVACNLIRFDGQSWQENTTLQPWNFSYVQGCQQRYAYGPDYAALIFINTSGNGNAYVLGYDAAGSDWTAQPATLDLAQDATSYQDTANWPGTSADYLVLGTQIYFRGTATDWGKAVSQGTSKLGDIQTLVNQAEGQTNRYQLNSESLINEGPNFLAFALYDAQDGTQGQAAVLVLQNGGVYGAAQVLGGERMWTNAENDAGGSGLAPGGSSAFAAYIDTANDFDSATTVYLHRYAGNAIQGNISDWPVSRISIDDALYESSTTDYVQDTATAACDPTGMVVKYYQTTVYPGGSAGNPVNGSVACQYLNGNAIVTGDNYYNMLDGLLYQVTSLDADGKLAARLTNSWQAYTRKAGSPTDASAAPVNLFGAYVLQTGKSTLLDGVASQQSTSYLQDGFAYPFNGQTVAVTTQSTTVAGQTDTMVQTAMYACQVNAPSLALNDLTTVVQQTTTLNGVTVNASANTLALWPSLWGEGVVVPAQEASFTWTGGGNSFPFGNYVPGQSPANWQCGGRTQDYAPNGVPLQQTDGAGIPSAAIYAMDLGLPIANFTGAALAECAWAGFQTYEDDSGWTLTNTRVCTDNACLGTQSLCLPAAAGSSLSTSVAPAANRTSYLLAYRYLTATGYEPQGAGFAIQAGGQTTQSGFTDTAGAWVYAATQIALPEGTASVAVEAANPGNGDVLLDSVLLMPLETTLAIQSWQADSRLLRASMIANGGISRVLYDRCSRPLGLVGPDSQVQELGILFASRQGSIDGSYDNTSPNAELSVQMAEGGSAETFIDGGAWQSRWQPDDGSLWTASAGRLVKSSSTADTLVWQGAANAGATTAFVVEMQPQANLSSPVSIQFGGGQTIRYTPNQGWSWTDGAGNPLQSPLASPPAMAGLWLLVLGDGITVFYGDGQLLFCQNNTAQGSQGFSFNTGSNPLAIHNLVAANSPRLSCFYTDGAARQRQVHELSGADSLVTEMVYDALDRQIAGTRVAPGSFGTGATIPTLQYRDTFLNVPAFFNALTNTCEMSGDIADYYAGQNEGLVYRSNDQSYPYFGCRYFTTPGKRIVESGLPGLTLSIHDVDSTTAAQRQTLRTGYGASSSTDHLPAAEFYTQTFTMPSGLQSRMFIDKTQALSAVTTMDGQCNALGQTQVSQVYDDAEGSAATTLSLRLPNAFTDSPQSDPSAFVRVATINPAGQVSSYADPDTGTTNVLYNGQGQIRFVQTPLQSGETFYGYTSYNSQGLIIEEGSVNAAWDDGFLQTKVDDLSFPSGSDGANVARRYTYGGSRIEDLGLLTEVVTYNPAPAADPGLGDCTITETWQHDSLGRVITAGMVVAGATPVNTSVAYHYDTLSEIVQVDLPDGCPIPGIVYGYNDQGQAVKIGTPDNDSAFAQYTWTADGHLATAVRGALTEAWGYDSSGNILKHIVNVQGETVFEQDYTYTVDAQIASRQNTFGFDGRSGGSTVNYSYDGQQRFTAATDGSEPGNCEAVSLYDANGNLWQGSAGGQDWSASYNPGTDRLQTATTADESIQGFQYRDDGRPSQWRGMAIGYDEGLGTLATISSTSGTVRYARGYNNRCLLRQSGQQITLSFYGAGQVPLIVWNNGVAEIAIVGPQGLVAVQGEDEIRHPIADHQQTVWAVADGSGNLTAWYNYLPFGAITSQGGPEAETWPIRYMGKAWDGQVGLYDFGARPYDPLLRQFLLPDAARQFASPYVFLGNDPINQTDPSGNMSTIGQVFMDIAMAVVAIAGVVLTVATAGAAAGVEGGIIAGEAGAVGGEVGAETSLELGIQAASEIDTEASGMAGARAGVDLGAEAAGESFSAKASKALAKKSVKAVLNVAAGALIAGGTKGLGSSIKNPGQSAGQVFKAFGIGLASGAVTGLFSVGGGMLTSTIENKLVKVVAGAAVKMVAVDAGKLTGDLCTMTAPTVKGMVINSVSGLAWGALNTGMNIAYPPDSYPKTAYITAAVSATANAVQKTVGTVYPNGNAVYPVAALTTGYPWWGSVKQKRQNS